MANQLEPRRLDSPNGVVHALTPIEELFDNPEEEQAVKEAILDFATGVDTITLEELRAKVAESKKIRQ